jgi:hypothetical protein
MRLRGGGAKNAFRPMAEGKAILIDHKGGKGESNAQENRPVRQYRHILLRLGLLTRESGAAAR